MKDNTVLLVISLACAIAGGILGIISRAWAITLVAIAAGIIALVLLF